MTSSITSLPAAHTLVDEAVRFGMPEDNRHGYQVIVERWLGIKPECRAKPAKAKVKTGRVAWKLRDSMRGGSCGQCGDGGNGRGGGGGGHLNLCHRCFEVLAHSRRYWVPNPDFPSAG